MTSMLNNASIAICAFVFFACACVLPAVAEARTRLERKRQLDRIEAGLNKRNDCR
jgi:hypothetical protein